MNSPPTHAPATMSQSSPAPTRPYAYSAVSSSGTRIHGASRAATPGALRRSLEMQGLLVLDVTPCEDPHPRPNHDVLELTRALAALLAAGMSLPRALAAASNVAGAGTSASLADVRARVERGDSLASALATHPHAFSPLYVGVVRAGERGGDLAAAFARLTSQLERDAELRARLLSAAIYPTLLATLGAAAVGILLVFVLPRFAELLADSGAPLPRSTALLLGCSALLRRHWPALLATTATGAAGAAWTVNTPAGRRAYAATLLHLPIIGPLRANVLAARFARLTGVLLGGGAPLYTALRYVLDSVADPIAHDAITRARTRVREGATLHRALADETVFPALLHQLVAVGEESGRLRQFLLEAADIFEDRADRATRRLVALAEPATIVAFGGVIGFVALSLLQAIYGVDTRAFR